MEKLLGTYSDVQECHYKNEQKNNLFLHKGLNGHKAKPLMIYADK